MIIFTVHAAKSSPFTDLTVFGEQLFKKAEAAQAI